MRELVKSDIKSGIFLVIVIIVCTLFLSGANAFYQGVLAERQRGLRMKVLETFGISFTEDNFNTLFSDNVDIVTILYSIY